MEEFKGTGSVSLSKVYACGLNLISQRTINGQPSTNYFGTDGHGSVRFLTDGAGAVSDTYTYDAYGILIATNGTTDNNYLYCCEEFDPETGMYYLRARYYKPDTGRFWTMDSEEGNNEDPPSLHKYLYCNDNPVNLKDPSGKDACVIVIDGRTGHTCFGLTNPNGGVRIYHFYAHGHMGLGGSFDQDRGLIYDTVHIWHEDWSSVRAFVDDKTEDGSDVKVEAIAAGTAKDDKRMFDYLTDSEQLNPGYYSFLGGVDCYTMSWAWFRKYSNWNEPVDATWGWNSRISANGGPPLLFRTRDFGRTLNLPFMPLIGL